MGGKVETTETKYKKQHFVCFVWTRLCYCEKVNNDRDHIALRPQKRGGLLGTWTGGGGEGS